MSTKTKLKRIAVVAVSALGLGLLSVTPSSAAVTSPVILASVANVPFAGETINAPVATLQLDFTDNDAGANSATVNISLTRQPSGAGLTNANISVLGTAANINTGVNPAALTSQSFVTTTVTNALAESDYSVYLNNTQTLVAGEYSLTFTPDAISVAAGATVQTVNFSVTPRPTDGPRLAAVNATARTANTGLIRDPQRVYVGGSVQNGAGGVGSIRLRADLISFPTAGYVNTVATDGATNFLTAPTPLVDGNSNLVTYVGTFNDCAPGDTSANCDSVTSSGTAGLAEFTFTPTVAGSYTMRVWQDANNNGLLDVNEVRTDITLTVAAFPTVSTTFSRSVINTEAGGNAYASDQTVLAPMGTGATSTRVARIRVTLNSTASTLAGDVRMDGRATFPTISASIADKGPGLLAVSAAGGAANPTGRNVAYTITSAATDVVQNVFFVDVFNDGTNGVSTITINLNGAAWQTETVSFFGSPATVTVAQNIKVVPAASAASVTVGCANLDTVCTKAVNGAATLGTAATVANWPAATVTVRDSAGILVPGATITATSSNTAVVSSTIASAAGVAGSGVYNTDVTSVLGSTSGQSATLTYTATLGTASASSSPVTFKVGGAAATAAMAITASTEVGARSSMTFTARDAAGNAPFDAYHALTLASNVAITSALGTVGDLPLAGNRLLVDGASVPVAIEFFNPLVPATVNLTGTLSGAAISGSFSVTNSAVDAAADAALEAIDAANAATDAANLAAEAADAATVAAEEARDAADAATAAVEALASEVATLIAGLKAQITTLANTVAKIAKKVRA